MVDILESMFKGLLVARQMGLLEHGEVTEGKRERKEEVKRAQLMKGECVICMDETYLLPWPPKSSIILRGKWERTITQEEENDEPNESSDEPTLGARLECGHVLCTSCLEQYILVALKKSGQPRMIECPMKGCTLPLRDKEAFLVLSQKDLDRWALHHHEAGMKDKVEWTMEENGRGGGGGGRVLSLWTCVNFTIGIDNKPRNVPIAEWPFALLVAPWLTQGYQGNVSILDQETLKLGKAKGWKQCQDCKMLRGKEDCYGCGFLKGDVVGLDLWRNWQESLISDAQAPTVYTRPMRIISCLHGMKKQRSSCLPVCA
ncbi:MAG: hypothetical protein DHS80DRAFT_21965 [Piptocephalis tieghemiana]|nr:MAG: hypothetical protein DHS80DRAFT_21965 [Piptocephalis tieghemiana]